MIIDQLNKLSPSFTAEGVLHLCVEVDFALLWLPMCSFMSSPARALPALSLLLPLPT